MLSSLALTDFRNHTSFVCDFSSRITVITGPNGSGKTSILEGIYSLANGHPFTVASTAFVIRTGASEARVMGVYFDTDIGAGAPYSVTFCDSPRRTTFLRHSEPTTRPKYLEAFASRAILFSPMDLNILYLGPDLRRGLFDETLSLVYTDFPRARLAYDRALASRNRVLRDIRAHGRDGDREMLGYWDRILAEKMTVILAYRKRLVDYIREYSTVLSGLFPEYTCIFRYFPKVPLDADTNAILAILCDRRDKDTVVGYTTAGPQADDYGFFIVRDSQEYASDAYLSRGENKSLIIAFRLLLLQFFESVSGTRPILLLDDFFSELDRRHGDDLLARLDAYQICITTQMPLSTFPSLSDASCIELS